MGESQRSPQCACDAHAARKALKRAGLGAPECSGPAHAAAIQAGKTFRPGEKSSGQAGGDSGGGTGGAGARGGGGGGGSDGGGGFGGEGGGGDSGSGMGQGQGQPPQADCEPRHRGLAPVVEAQWR